jgi:di/tricarboxylate transporter
MEIHAWIAIATLVVAMVLFISKLIPLEATALSIPVVLAVTGTVTAEAALRGFGNNAVIALGAIFVLSAGLQESGVATLMGRMLERFGGKKEWSLVLLIMITTCVLSAIMSNAATVAVFLPAVLVLSRRAKISPSRLMMPLGYSAILGGTLPLISTTPNLILGSELERLSGGARTLGMFEFAIVGIPISIVGIAYMALIGTRLLRRRGSDDSLKRKSFRDRMLTRYQPERKLYKLTVPSGSEFDGSTIAQANLGRRYEIEVVQIGRKKGFRGDQFLDVQADLAIKAGDVLFVGGRDDVVQKLAEELSIPIETGTEDEVEKLLGRGINMAEVTLSPYSAFLDRTLIDISFRGVFGLSVIAIWRHGKLIEKDVGTTPLKLGDALLVYGPVRNIRKLEESDDMVLLERQLAEEDVRRAPLALLLLAVALAPPVLGWYPLAVSALASALLMMATGCVSLRGAQKAVDFRILFLIIGTIPLGDALYQTGVAGKLAMTLFPPGMSLGQFYVFGILFALSALLSTTSNNAAAAVILAPVAYAAAESSGVDVGMAFLAVAYGASCAFVLPFAHQCNLMIMGPGGYQTKDFVKVGSGLSIVMAVTAVVFLSL